jgi:hypothetical protein
VDSEHPKASDRIIPVGARDSLQVAIDKAEPGDVIELEPGTVYRGPFILPEKEGTGWIIIRTADEEGKLPSPGSRVTPGDAANMARLEARRDSVVKAAPRASHYRFVGVEFGPAKGQFINNLIDLGSGEKKVEELPANIIFDRCLIRGDPKVGGRRGIAMNSAYTAVIDSHLSDFKEVGADSQAVAGWNGTGPFKIVNNYIEGAGENVMFGGADPHISDLVPSDIEIRGNHFSKPLSWRNSSSKNDGAAWTVKNLFELKNARRVLVEGNLFEHNWAHGQDGTAILFTVRNQDGDAPWSVVEDVQFINNVVRRVGNGVTILGRDDNHKSEVTRRIYISNNLFHDIGGDWGRGVFLLLSDGTMDVVVEYNMVFQTHNIITSAEGSPHRGFEFVGNIVAHNEYGIIGSGKGIGTSTLAHYFPDSTIRNNVIVGGPAERYPEGNHFPSTFRRFGLKGIDNASYPMGKRVPDLVIDDEDQQPGVDVEVLCSVMWAHGGSMAGQLAFCGEYE